MLIFGLSVLACRSEPPVRSTEPSAVAAAEVSAASVVEPRDEAVAPQDVSDSAESPEAEAEAEAGGEAPAQTKVAPIVWKRADEARLPIENEAMREAHAAASSRLRRLQRLSPLGPLRPRGGRGRGAPGAFTPLEDPPEQVAMASFYRDLQALEAGDKDKVRVLIYGASGIEADVTAGYVRTYLQTRFGDGGPGFVPFVPLNGWYRHNSFEVSASPRWRDEHAQKPDARMDGNYGLLGVSFASKRKGAWAEVGPSDRSVSSQTVSNIELFFLQQPGGGRFEVRIDDVARETVETAADAVQPGYRTYTLEPGPHRVRIRHLGGGEVRVFGAVFERDEPGVVVDTLGLGGTRATNQIEWNRAVWDSNITRRDPSLFILDFGTNESMDRDQPIGVYRGKLRAVLTTYRELFPNASCVLSMPGDFPIVRGRKIRPRPRLEAIIEVQREVAPEFGCAVWDTLAFMGGPGSMARWVRARPPMAKSDHVHLNLRGQIRQGQALVDALMWSFDATLDGDASTAGSSTP